MTKSNQTPAAKPASIRIRLMEAIKKKRKPMTLTQLYTVAPEKPKATVRGVLNGNVGKYFDRVSEGTYDIIRPGKDAASKSSSKTTGAGKPATKSAGKAGAKPAAKAAAKPATKTGAKPATKAGAKSTGTKSRTAASKAQPTSAKATATQPAKAPAAEQPTKNGSNATTGKQ